MSDVDGRVNVRPAEAKDAPALYAMIRELAAHQDELDYIQATPESFARDAFGAEPLFAALIAEAEGGAIEFYESLGATIVLRGMCYWRPGN